LQEVRLSEAADAFARAVAINPTFAGANFNKALALEEQGLSAEAAPACVKPSPSNRT
jgi:hypothetical protein